MPEQHQRTVNVYLTAAQTDYLKEEAETDLVITMVDDRGGIFVEDAATVGAEGSGVWVDAAAQEHHGPGGTFVQSKGATEYQLKAQHDPDGRTTAAILGALEELEGIDRPAVIEARRQLEVAMNELGAQPVA